MFKLQPHYVVSSNLDCAAYQDTLMFLRFKNGTVYQYLGIPKTTYDALILAESVGKAFHALIKDKYPYVKLDYDPFLAGAAC